MHFSFNEFAQIVIGTCVFGLPAFFTPDIWDFISELDAQFLFFLYLFFILCIFIAVNYEFRDNMSPDPWFLRMIFKRVFYHYTPVLIVITLILVFVSKITYDLSNLDVARNFLAAQSIGIFGAITYSFLRK